MKAVLMRPEDVINVDKAAHHARKSTDTIRRWCRKHGLARQSCHSAPLEISAPALEMVLHSDLDALELLRAGRRDHPDVRRYLDHLGLPV
jgi:hypothetical protein